MTCECSECGREFQPESGEKPVRCECGAPAYRKVVPVPVPHYKRGWYSVAAGLALVGALVGCGGGPRHYWTAEHKAVCRESRLRSRCVRVFGNMEARVQAAEDRAASAAATSGVALGLAAGSAGGR